MELTPFDYSGKTVRIIIDENGEKYRDVLAKLDPDERVSVLVDNPGGKQTMTGVYDPCFYPTRLCQLRRASCGPLG